MCSKDSAKRLLFLFNFILWLGGAFLLAIGVWVKVDPTMVRYLHVVSVSPSDPLLQYAACVLMVAGGLSFFVGIVGCCGAMREHQGLLFLYAILLAIIMLAEIAAAILALMYRNQIETEMVTGMTKQISHDYVVNSTTWSAWNWVQQTFKCCGGANYTDYNNSNWWNTSRGYINETEQLVPDSCCVSATGGDPNSPHVNNWVQCQLDAATAGSSVSLYTQGCLDQMNDWVNDHTLVLVLVGFGIGCSQMLGLLIALCLRTALKAEMKHE